MDRMPDWPAGSAADFNERRSALLLHALREDDRTWLLQRLSGPRRARLQGLLLELSRLDFPADLSLVDHALAAHPLESVLESLESALPDPRRRLMCLPEPQWTDLAAVLRSEPDALVHAFLAVDAWPWAAHVASTCGRPHRLPESAAASLGPASQTVLIDAIDRKLSEFLTRKASREGRRGPDASTQHARSRLSTLRRMWKARQRKVGIK